MIFKHMYCGYKKDGNIKIKKDERIITASASTFEGMTFLYFESKDGSLKAADVAEGNMKAFPDGADWFEMSEIFHYFTPENDSQWERKIENKKPGFLINKLNRDKIASYIYYHFDHQNSNPYDVDKYMSIFNYGDVIVMYHETPTEKVTWQDIEGRFHKPDDPLWDDLMDEHFKAWPDGKKKWVKIEETEY